VVVLIERFDMSRNTALEAKCMYNYQMVPMFVTKIIFLLVTQRVTVVTDVILIKALI
jgi:hypothetical protein